MGRKKKDSGIGRSIIRDRFQGKRAAKSGDSFVSSYHVTDLVPVAESGSVARLWPVYTEYRLRCGVRLRPAERERGLPILSFEQDAAKRVRFSRRQLARPVATGGRGGGLSPRWKNLSPP